mgnify:CR=1 FL=1
MGNCGAARRWASARRGWTPSTRPPPRRPPTSWGRTSWEAVAAANPEFLILLDYQGGDGAEGLLAFLKAHPVMSQTDAVKNERYVTLRYEELTPGPANIDAIGKIAKAIQGGAS